CNPQGKLPVFFQFFLGTEIDLCSPQESPRRCKHDMEYKEDRIERYQISGAAEGCVADEYGARYIYYEEDDCADSSIFHHFLMAVNIPVLFYPDDAGCQENGTEHYEKCTYCW